MRRQRADNRASVKVSTDAVDDVAWLKSLTCLKNCGMSLAEMKAYLALCLGGIPTIPERKIMLEGKRKELLEKMKALQEAVDYIDWKQGFYDDVLAGRTPYISNLLPNEADAESAEESSAHG